MSITDTTGLRPGTEWEPDPGPLDTIRPGGVSDVAGEPDSRCTMTFRSMNTDVHIEVAEPTVSAPRAMELARHVFCDIEATCTRFDPDSALMRANDAGRQWFDVPAVCYLAIAEAHAAHRETDGLFDPRILQSLVSLGYDRTLPFDRGPVTVVPSTSPSQPPTLIADQHHVGAAPWIPGLDPTRSAVRIGPQPIDLGGIGKGLAVRLAARELAGAGAAALVEAGGDLAVLGAGPDGTGWIVGVEDPLAEGSGGSGEEPVAVLNLVDTSCATSSLRKRTWTVAGQRRHHLIDPRTGASSDSGLRSVTVVMPDAARAEVWSKALLIAGAGRIAALAQERQLAALWVDDAGRHAMSAAMVPLVIWRRTDAC